MAKTPKRITDADLDPMSERCLDISQDARDLAAKVTKESFEDLGFTEPVRRAMTLQQAAASLVELSRVILMKVQLQEQKQVIETNLRARLDEKAAAGTLKRPRFDSDND
jgi:hypothetical protein